VKIEHDPINVPTVIIAVLVWLACFMCAMCYGADPVGTEHGTDAGIHGQDAVAFYGARCGDKFSLWVLLDNGHMIYFDDKDGAVVGEMLKQLAGKPSDFHDLCSESL
jgi:hypothetical protein